VLGVLFVVVRDAEDGRRAAVFSDRAEAERIYAEAYHVSENGPDDGPGDDPTIVSGCWFYVVDTPDPDAAKALALKGDIAHLKAFEDDYPS
jgi:hypothetical protein